MVVLELNCVLFIKRYNETNCGGLTYVRETNHQDIYTFKTIKKKMMHLLYFEMKGNLESERAER